jgi:hypothetical protein
LVLAYPRLQRTGFPIRLDFPADMMFVGFPVNLSEDSGVGPIPGGYGLQVFSVHPSTFAEC